MSNMSVEDILDEIGGYGSVTLRKVKFPVNASHGNGRRPLHPQERWTLEIVLDGYNTKYGSWRETVEGRSIRDVAEAAYSLLEEYVFSPTAEEDRQRYVDQIAFYQERYEHANTYERMSAFNPIRPPGHVKPPIVWGKARSWQTIERASDPDD